ncbi:SMI1/KNR4 family protein [Streptomyces rishiriensis]|uniref:Knr4/Smi1-like domain-containing protein n=1 Tax=Streptomyces rishiriensis TaxID=68264 RepID=A0ABU0NW94_STRRH|nr:SMI1/KNR4 family protein [Streptomyces rishiriensis]MDQ0582807.1 hypothetical protein [Streptomyces rishiriensis]
MTENEQLWARAAAEAASTRPCDRPSFPDPVDAATVARAEAALGFPLPPLLADPYLRTGDGGFRSEYGLLPLLDSLPAGEPAAVSPYLANRESGHEDPDRPWPEGVLPISHWGCAMYACVDCRSPRATVLPCEPNPGDPDHAWLVDALGPTTWLHPWLVDAPRPTAWLHARLDGTGWYGTLGDDLEPTPWTEFRIRTAAA